MVEKTLETPSTPSIEVVVHTIFPGVEHRVHEALAVEHEETL
jgi:hypothetical protein